MRPSATQGNKKRDKLGDKLRDRMGDKSLGRRTHHPTQAHMWGDNRRQGEIRLREGGRAIQQKEARETMENKGRQDCGKMGASCNNKADTLSKHYQPQRHTFLGRRGVGDTGRQCGTRPREGGHTITHTHTHTQDPQHMIHVLLYPAVSPQLSLLSQSSPKCQDCPQVIPLATPTDVTDLPRQELLRQGQTCLWSSAALPADGLFNRISRVIRIPLMVDTSTAHGF